MKPSSLLAAAPAIGLSLVSLATLAPTPATARAPSVFALTGAKIVVAPGRVIDQGTVVLRDGVIEAVGADVVPPADARVLERPDMTVYPGLLDAYLEASWPESDGEARTGSHPNEIVRPERAMALHGVTKAAAEKHRAAGFTTAAVAPAEGLFRGRSAVLNLGDGSVNENLLRAAHAQNVTFARNAQGGGYPSSLMGSVALFRQTLLDARNHDSAWQAYESKPAQRRPPLNPALSELVNAASGRELVVFEADDALDTLRSASLIQEFGLDAHVVGSGDEYQWLSEVSATDLPLIVPVAFPALPDPPKEDDLALGLKDLRHWDRAPSNVKALLDAGSTVAVTAHGLDEPADVLKHLHIAIDRGGLSAEEALAAITTTPAELLGIADRAATIEPGKMANLVLVEGDLFAKKPNVREVWIDGRRYEVKERKAAEVEPAGTWELSVTTGDGQVIPAVMTLEGDAASLSGTISDPAGNQVPLSSAEVSGTTLEVAFDGTAYGMPGTIEFTLNIKGDSGSGEGTSPGGPFTIKGSRSSSPPEVTE